MTQVNCIAKNENINVMVILQMLPTYGAPMVMGVSGCQFTTPVQPLPIALHQQKCQLQELNNKKERS